MAPRQEPALLSVRWSSVRVSIRRTSRSNSARARRGSKVGSRRRRVAWGKPRSTASVRWPSASASSPSTRYAAESSGWGDVPGYSGRVPLDAGRGLRRERGGHGLRDHDDVQCRGRRCRGSGEGGRPAGGHIVHRRDGWPAPERTRPRRRHRRSRPGDRRVRQLLHDQLRASHPLRPSSRRGATGPTASEVSGPMPRGRATPSSTKPPSSTRAIRRSSGPSTLDS